MKKFLLTLTLILNTLAVFAQGSEYTKRNILEDFLTIVESKWYIAGNTHFPCDKNERNVYGMGLGTRIYYPCPLYALDLRADLDVAKRTKKAQISASALFFIDHLEHFHFYIGAGAIGYYKTEKIVDQWGILDHNVHGADFKLSAGTELRADKANHYFVESYYLPLEGSVGVASGVCF